MCLGAIYWARLRGTLADFAPHADRKSKIFDDRKHSLQTVFAERSGRRQKFEVKFGLSPSFSYLCKLEINTQKHSI